MARVAFISDLHANLVALDAALAEIDALGVTQIICLGDIVDLGPEPQAVVDRLAQRGVRCVRGNHDPLDEHPGHPLLQAIEDWTREQLAPETLAALAALPDAIELELDGVQLLCVHGSPHDINDQILAQTPDAQLLAWAEGRAFDLLVCGHTHVQLLRRVDARVFVNVGSLGMPFAQPYAGQTPEVLPWAEYAIVGVDQGHISVDLRRLPYDLDRFRASLRASGYPGGEAWLDNWRLG